MKNSTRIRIKEEAKKKVTYSKQKSKLQYSEKS
jgi:hypothetical protein